MKLFLLRHGEAESRAASDASRHLTSQGRSDIQNVAEQFASQTLSIDHCFVSPFIRAQQTAEEFLAKVGKKALTADFSLISESLLVPDTRASGIMEFLELNHINEQENILLISHNPLLSELNALLQDGDISQMHILTTGELICLELDIIGLGQATSAFSLVPASKVI